MSQLVSTIDGRGQTPLMEAADSGDINKVRSLIDGGTGVNKAVKTGMLEGCVPLHQAAVKGHIDVVLLLIEKGADVNASCSQGWSPLHSSVFGGHANVVQILISNGADANIKASYAGGEHIKRITPLHLAAAGGHADIVRILLDAGANPIVGPARVVSGFQFFEGTPRQLAKNLGYATIIRMLEEAEGVHYGSVAENPTVVATKKTVKSDVDFLPSVKVKSKKNAYAIVIGIEKYREKLPPVDFANNDAKLVTKYLTKTMGYPKENVVTLLGEKAARTDIKKYIEKWLPNNMEKGGTILIYYSGHGAPDPTTGDAFIVPYDGDPTFIDETGYPLSRLYKVLDRLPAKEVVVMLDSCFSGAGGRSVIAEGARPIVVKMKENMKVSKKTVVLSASSGNQISSTYKEKGHGLFTYFMLKGLKGEGDTNRDGRIETNELFNYIKPNVTRIARKQYNNEQTPQMISPKGRNIFLMGD